jgi:PD-(D/E)XK endonuclease
LVPFGTNQRYDLVLDLDGELVRVQCKTGRLRDGTVRFSTQSIQSNTRRTVMRGYLGDADLFLVYCPEIGKVYVVPVEEVGVSETYLRVDPVRNGQSHGVRWAEDYELPG